MPEGGDNTGGVVASAKRLGYSLIGLLRSRLELLSVELQEEKVRALNLLLWLTIAIAFGVATILLSIGTLSLFLWQRAGYAGLLGLTAFSLAAAAGLNSERTWNAFIATTERPGCAQETDPRSS